MTPDETAALAGERLDELRAALDQQLAVLAEAQRGGHQADTTGPAS